MKGSFFFFNQTAKIEKYFLKTKFPNKANRKSNGKSAVAFSFMLHYYMNLVC